MPRSNARATVSRWVAEFGGAIASVLFPSDCRICGALLTRADRLPVCDACLGAWFAKRLQEIVRGLPEKHAPDLLVPVPLHCTRQKERGFNQVDLFGKPLARRLGLPYRPVLLKRNRPRPEKHLLHFDERWGGAVRGAFVIQEGGRVDNFRILLLDDVMTSGATLDACSRCVTRCRRQIGCGVDDRPGRAASHPRQRKCLA